MSILIIYTPQFIVSTYLLFDNYKYLLIIYPVKKSVHNSYINHMTDWIKIIFMFILSNNYAINN